MARKKSDAIPEWIKARLTAARAEMAKSDLPAYLLTRHMDTFYMTGFTGEDSAVIVMPRAVHLVSDSRFDEAIDAEVPWVKKHLRKGLLVDEIANVCRKLKLERIAIQADDVSVQMLTALRKSAKPTRTVTAPPIVNRLRMAKDPTELKTLCKAITVAQDAFLATRKSIRVGQTEEEVAARLEYEMRKRGSTCAAFGTMVAVGANASHPHAHAGKRKITRGCAILFDWGATVGFYRSDLTRCLFMGRIPSRIREIYKVVLDAQLAAIEAIRPGARMCDVDGVARKLITRAGYGKQFGHGLGHGLGLDVHEAPSLSWRSNDALEPGSVVTVEPGIYLPGVGGVRIEDDVLVTSSGHRILSDLTKDLRSAVL